MRLDKEQEMIWTMRDIMAKNKEVGQHWFDPGAMRFFNSKVLPDVYQGKGGIFFVSSEQFVSSNGEADKRMHTVRKFDPVSGHVATVGEFNKLSLHNAKKKAQILAEGA